MALYQNTIVTISNTPQSIWLVVQSDTIYLFSQLMPLQVADVREISICACPWVIGVAQIKTLENNACNDV